MDLQTDRSTLLDLVHDTTGVHSLYGADLFVCMAIIINMQCSKVKEVCKKFMQF